MGLLGRHLLLAPGARTVSADAGRGPEGRALDAEIARVVFGLEVEYRQGAGWPGSDDEPLVRFAPRRESLWPSQGLERIPHYSTRIEDAWKIVERFHDFHMWSGGHYLDPPSLVGSESRLHVVKLWVHRGEQTSRAFQANADTLPLAICRAALAALGATGAGEGDR